MRTIRLAAASLAAAVVLTLVAAASASAAHPTNAQCDHWTNTGVLNEWVGYRATTGTANPTGVGVATCVGVSGSHGYGYGADAFTGTNQYLGRWATVGYTIDGDTYGRTTVQYAQAASCPIWGPAFVGAVYVSTGTRVCA